VGKSLPPTQIDNVAGPLLPVWLIIATAVCLPFCIAAMWRLGRWWMSTEPIPLPFDNALPAVRWPPAFGVALFVGMTVLMVGIANVFYPWAAKAGLLPWEPLGVPAMFSPGIFLGQIVPPLVGLIVIRFYGRGAAATIGVRTGPLGRTLWEGLRTLMIVLPLCLAALLINVVVVGLLGGQPEVHPLLKAIETVRAPWVVPLALVQAGLLAALAEEFLYRGVLMMTLLKAMGTDGAIVTSSALFALVHLQSEPQAVLPLFVLAVAMGYAAYRTRSLLAPMLTHALFNSLMVLGTFYGAP